jgi:Zn-dependent protease
MKGSIKLFRVFGISIEIHITFLILPLLFWFGYGIKGVFVILAVFTCVTLHELSHSLAAKNFGIKVDRITLLPIGGIASMRSLPETPAQEFIVSFAGPLFNIVVTIVLFYPLMIILGLDTLLHPDFHTWTGAIAYSYWVNPVLAGFNLLPAFPMDGGRILRALLSRKFSYLKATKIAVGFGHVFALLFALFSFATTPPNFILLLIAFFIFIAASHEESIASMKTTLGKMKVKDVLSPNYYTVSSSTPLSNVLGLVFHTHQEDFPVVDEGKLVGFLSRRQIISAVHEQKTSNLVSDLMLKDFPFVSPQDYLATVYNKFQNLAVKALPVVEDSLLKGVITLEDISRIYSVLSKGEG